MVGQAPVRVSDLGFAQDAQQIQTNIVRVDSQRSVYTPVLKQGGDTNTIAVVDGVKDSIAHLLDVPALERAYRRMRKDAAVGVDGVTKEQYGQGLEPDNARALSWYQLSAHLGNTKGQNNLEFFTADLEESGNYQSATARVNDAALARAALPGFARAHRPTPGAPPPAARGAA